MAAGSTEMVWGNKKAAADNDTAPVRGSRLCIHDKKDRTRGKPPLKELFRLPYSCIPGMVCVLRAEKKMPVIIRHLFLHFHINGMAGSRVLGRQHFYSFFRSGLGILHDRFC